MFGTKNINGPLEKLSVKLLCGCKPGKLFRPTIATYLYVAYQWNMYGLREIAKHCQGLRWNAF